MARMEVTREGVSSVMQSQRMLPAGVRMSSARCPMARRGEVWTMDREGAVGWGVRVLVWALRRARRVVKDCPVGGTYWRARGGMVSFVGSLREEG